ncbi:MAG: hypothetical protein ACKOUR_08595, partial [Planctomycetota bacterium]
MKPSRSRRRTRIEALEERLLLSNDVVVGFGDVYGVRSRIDVDQVDNYTQEDGGTLEIEINSTTSFDRVQIAGQATLDGRLKVLVDPSYQPAEGDTFAVLSLSQPADGNFTDWEGIQLSNQFRLVPVLGPNSLQLVVSQTSSEIAFRTGSATSANQIATAIGGGSGSVTLTDVELSLSAFIHVRGNFTVEKHATERVTLATGLPQNLGEAAAAEPVRDYLEQVLQAASANDPTIEVSENLGQITNWPVSMLTFGLANAEVFVGYGVPNLAAADWATADDLFGFAFHDVEFGFSWAWTSNPSLLIPSIYNPLQSFFGATMSAQNAELVGGGDVLQFAGTGFELQWNDNFGRWPLGMGPAVIDWATSYPTSSAGGFGKAIPTGEVDANGNLTFIRIAHDGNQRLGLGIQHAEVTIADFIHIDGSLYFEKGPQQLVTLATGLPQNLGESAAAALVQPFVDAVAEAGLGIEFPSEDDDGNPIPRYSRITGWDVATTYLGGHDLDVFVGYGSPDFTKSNWMNDDDLYGFGFEGVTFGYAQMDSTTPEFLRALAGDALDSFYAATLTAEHAGFVGGGDYLKIEATGFELQWNDNTGRWPLDMGPAVVDWAVTFPAVDSDLDGTLEPVGKPIRTGAKDSGGKDIYVYMGHDGNQRQALGVEHAAVSIADFIHLDGSFYFEKGPQQKITIATGLPQNLGESLAAEAIQPFVDAVAEAGLGIEFPSEDDDGNPIPRYSRITGWDVATTYLGGHDVDVFVGFGTPDFSKSNWMDDGDLFGFGFEGVNFAFAQMDSTTPKALRFFAGDALDRFYAATMTAEHAGFVGGGDYLKFEATGFELQWNDNPGRWPLDMGPAVVDWAVTFPAVDSDQNGTVEPLGKPIRTGAKDSAGKDIYVYMAHDGNQRLGLGLEYAELSIADFIHASGSLYFEQGPQQKVVLNTGLPLNLTSTIFADLYQPFIDALGDDVLGIEISDDLQTITGWDVATTFIGGSSLNVFVGFGDPDFSDPDWLDDSDLYGFGLSNVDFAFARMDSTTPKFIRSLVGDALDRFYAAKINADQARFNGGGALLELDAHGLELRWNDNTGSWPLDMGPAVIDWQATYPAGDSDGDGIEEPAGKRVRTGAKQDGKDVTVNLDYNGSRIVGIRVEDLTMRALEYFHVQGSFFFEMGERERVTIATGLQANVAAVADVIQPFLDALLEYGAGASISDDLQTLYNWEVRGTYLGGSNVNVFVGFGEPDFTDPQWFEDEDLMGVAFAGATFGFARMDSTMPEELLVWDHSALDHFLAANLKIETGSIIGFGDWLSVEGTGYEVEINYNLGSWPLDLGMPVIDWENTFVGPDLNGDGKADYVGKPVKTGARNEDGEDELVYISSEGQERLRFSVE